MSRMLVRAVLATVAALTFAAPAMAASRDVTVMTRNLYLGADLIQLAVQPNVEAFEAAAAARFQTVLANDFPTRAKGLAAEIAAAKPDLVGIQEAATWRKSPDGVKDGSATQANDLVYDSLASLLAELEVLGANYRVVASRPWFDYEAPTSLGFDVRLTQNDVVLARTGAGARVKVGKGFTGGFTKTFDVPTQVGVAKSARGWAGVDASVGGRKFRFVTTHLEAYSAAIADTQMRQLLRGPLRSTKRQSILVGDFNADPKNAKPNAYASARAAKFSSPLGRRATCCFAEDLRIEAGTLKTWIDHVVARPKAKAVRSSRVGATIGSRVGGLWPSDHAGIVATLRLK